MDEHLLKNKQLWGKYNPENGYHPAVYHMLDVALVAGAIFELLDGKEQEQLIAPFRYCNDPLAALQFLIALHDLGKLTPGFQLKLPEWKQLLSEQGFEWERLLTDENTNHGYTGYFLLTELLSKALNLRKEAALGLANAVAGHHGSFFGAVSKLRPGKGLWCDARDEAVKWLQVQLSINWEDIKVDEAELTPAYIVTLAGFCAVSDWLGSDEATFSYLNTGDYDLAQRKVQASQLVASLNLKKSGLAAGESRFEEIFAFSPNATQLASLALFDKTDSPTLTIIETPMGSGKTEAALALVDKYIREQGKAGFYFALPTQATGNQLFERALAFLKQHPAKTSDSNLELHLRHSNASLNAEYELLQTSSINHNEREGVMASRWFTSNKRGLLSTYAVGTVDQCLMASLQVRHFFVRIFGLSNKVVIIDEVHAYATYTSSILECLLAWLSAINAPVILLSATLPASRRKALMAAYHREGVSLQGAVQKYPRITCLSSSGHYAEVNVLDEQSKLPATFDMKLVESSLNKRWDKVKVILDDALEQGGCAACIVNTVKDAQRLFELLQEHYKDDSETQLILFHARFPLFQRLEIEQDVKRLFGKGEAGDLPNSQRPQKAIIVSTQVLEQSLDVDFDVMISMLAPIDLLLQRAGRVHRHYKNNAKRPAKLAKPTLYCLHPNVNKETDDARVIFGNAEAYIYEPYCLFYTVLSLKKQSQAFGDLSLLTVNMPDDIETLIDEVYEGKLAISNEEQQLRGEVWEIEARQKQRVETKLASDIKLPSPHSRLRDFFMQLEKAEDDEKVALTRLAPPSVALVLMQKNAVGQWCLLENNTVIDLDTKPDKTMQHLIVRSSVRISKPEWVKYFSETALAPKAWQKVAVLMDCYPLYLIENSFQVADIKGVLLWDSELGLVIKDA